MRLLFLNMFRARRSLLEKLLNCSFLFFTLFLATFRFFGSRQLLFHTEVFHLLNEGIQVDSWAITDDNAWNFTPHVTVLFKLHSFCFWVKLWLKSILFIIFFVIIFIFRLVVRRKEKVNLLVNLLLEAELIYRGIRSSTTSIHITIFIFFNPLIFKEGLSMFPLPHELYNCVIVSCTLLIIFRPRPSAERIPLRWV